MLRPIFKKLENKAHDVHKRCCTVADKLVEKYSNLSVEECNEKIEKLGHKYDMDDSEISVIKHRFFERRNLHLQGE
jgi:hypothetical protein